MSNIFLSENIARHNTKGRTVGIGEWILRNGVWSMNIRPEPFYQNYTAQDNTKLSYCLKEEFSPNTQYLFNLWIDTDDVISNGTNVFAGLVVIYSDGTSYNIGQAKTNGFKHFTYLSTTGKSIDRLSVYYYTSINVYYRGDSFIVPIINNTNITKAGIINSGAFVETILPTAFGGDYITTNDFIEY